MVCKNAYGVLVLIAWHGLSLPAVQECFPKKKIEMGSSCSPCSMSFVETPTNRYIEKLRQILHDSTPLPVVLLEMIIQYYYGRGMIMPIMSRGVRSFNRKEIGNQYKDISVVDVCDQNTLQGLCIRVCNILPRSDAGSLALYPDQDVSYDLSNTFGMNKDLVCVCQKMRTYATSAVDMGNNMNAETMYDMLHLVKHHSIKLVHCDSQEAVLGRRESGLYFSFRMTPWVFAHQVDTWISRCERALSGGVDDEMDDTIVKEYRARIDGQLNQLRDNPDSGLIPFFYPKDMTFDECIERLKKPKSTT